MIVFILFHKHSIQFFIFLNRCDRTRILVAGIYVTSIEIKNTDISIWGLTPHGIFDESFGIDGQATYHFPETEDVWETAHAMQFDSQGRIIIAGNHDFDLGLWRFSAAGIIDEGYGSAGTAIYNNLKIRSDQFSSDALEIDSSGRIIVATTIQSENMDYGFVITNIAIWWYLSDGTLDETFGQEGVVIYGERENEYDYCTANSIAVDSTGKILVTGKVHNDDTIWDMAVWRFNEDGTADLTFGDNGIITYNNAAGGNSWDCGNSITLDSTGRIFIAGYSENINENWDIAVWCYNNDGTLDSTFGTNGIILFDSCGNSSYTSCSVTIDHAGRIILLGIRTLAEGE